MQNLIHVPRDAAISSSTGAWSPEPVTSPLLVEVLWRRRWTMALAVLVCLVAAVVYLLVATPVYRATALLILKENGPRAYSEPVGYTPDSDSYLQTQADVIKSASVLSRALETVQFRGLKTFATAGDDPVAWLRNGYAFKIEIPKRKSDTLYVSMDSPHPAEAAAFVDSVVRAYIQEQAEQNKATGTEMLRVLQKERDDLKRKREQVLETMVRIKRENGVLSFKDETSNTTFERTAALSRALTAAEIATMELRAQQRSVQAALADPNKLALFVAAQQSHAREFADQEYNDLQREMTRYALTVATNAPVIGVSHPRFQALLVLGDALKKRIAEKDKAVAESQLLAVSTQLAAAEDKERNLRSAMQAQQGHVLSLSPMAAQYANLEAESNRIQAQSDQLERRMAEVSINRIDTRPLNVQVLEPARVAQNPVKPRRVLVLAAALLVGCVVGVGLATMREWQDTRLRTPGEVLTRLGTPVVALVPRINLKLSPVARGQMVHLDPRSLVAEGYRSACTSLQLGVAKDARTILLTSPMEGDGKSTTASNLAIAFAKSGERTLVIDCDLRQPVQHLIFETGGEVGLTSVISGEVKLRDAVSPTDVAGLYVLACGPVPTNPVELLTGKRFARLMRSLGESFDRIIIDSPPLETFADTRVLAAAADATLLVLRMNQSAKPLGVLALDALSRVGANVLGAIVNDMPGGRPYRKYQSSWHYASREDRLLIPAHVGASAKNGNGKGHAEDHGNGNGNGNANGNGNGKTRALGRIASETLVINEPDWSGDKPD